MIAQANFSRTRTLENGIDKNKNILLISKGIRYAKFLAAAYRKLFNHALILY